MIYGKSSQLGSAEDNQADFRRDAQAHWGADGPKASVHVDVSHGEGSGGEERWAESPGDGSVGSSAFIGSRSEKRALIKAGDVVGDKARGAQAMVEDFDLDLSTVGVAGEGKFDARLCGAIEGVGIVRKKNVGHVAANEGLDKRESLLALAAGSALALVIDAEKIEGGALESNLRVFLAQHFHSGLSVEIGGFVLGARVNFVVAVAAPGAERSAKMANFFDAIGDGITAAGDEIAGDHGEVGAEIIGHIHGAANLGAGHIAAEVNVADLDNLHAIQSGGHSVEGEFDAGERGR